MAQRRSTLTLAVLVALPPGALALLLLALLPWWGALSLVALHVWFAWHGYLIVGQLAPSGDRGARALFGPVVGLGLCTMGLLVLWLLGARGAWMFLLAPWPIWALWRLPLERVASSLSVPRTSRADLVAVLLVLLIVPLVVGLPYAHVAAPMDDGGVAYRAYFTADFVWAMTTVAEVSKGDMPPANPFLRGDALRYYWLAHFLSSATYRVGSGWGLAIEPIVLANSVWYGVAFLLFLHGFVRAWGATAAASGAAITIVFLASSFEALDQAIAWRHRDHLWTRLTDVNIDAVTRWLYDGMPIDGLHRMLLYQPHHFTGYALGLLALLLVGRARAVDRSAVAVAAGTLLALSVLYSSFTAIIIGAAVAAVYAVRLMTPFRPLVVLRCAVLGALPVGVAVGASIALGYVDPKAGGLLQFGPSPLAFRHAPYVLFLSLGPPLLLGALGLAVGPWRRMLPLWMLVIAAFAFYFFVEVLGMGGVWVGWRSGHLLFLAFAALAAAAFTWAALQARRVRWAVWSATGLAVFAALPTVAIDVFNAQDLTNPRWGPSFPWVLRLSRDEAAALEWVRRHTAPDAIVQPDTLVRANASWGYITGFGQRRMAAGMPIAMIPLEPYERATRLVHQGLFLQESPAAATLLARRLGIDYVYVGPVERGAHADLRDRLASWPSGFTPVFRNRDVTIFRVVPLAR